MVSWQSDQCIVPLKQGNACGGKALTGRPLEGNTIARLRAGVRFLTKPKPVTCLDSEQGGFSEEPYAGNLRAPVCVYLSRWQRRQGRQVLAQAGGSVRGVGE